MNTHRAIINNQREANTMSYFDYSLSSLTFIEAENLYVEAYNLLLDGKPLDNLAIKYNVSIQYIKGLINGSERPYIRKKYNGKSLSQIYLSNDNYKTVIE